MICPMRQGLGEAAAEEITTTNDRGSLGSPEAIIGPDVLLEISFLL